MHRWTPFFMAVLLMLAAAMGCSGGNDLLTPSENGITGGNAQGQTQTHLWGYYNVYIDIPSQTATAILDRSAMFTANVTNFINGAPANLAFKIIGTPGGAGYVDIDIDVTIRHPFPGLSQYNGYDVRGVFMGNGSNTLAYNSDLKYADIPFSGAGADQQMYDYDIGGYNDIHPGIHGSPDGYTRWYNKPEFGTPGLFGYIQGKYASKNYDPTATLNPYKYFADTLGVTDDAWAFVNGKTAETCLFSAGSQNTRNYYLRFPTPVPNVVYGYAVIANWTSNLPEDHPSHAVEACVLSVSVTPELFYVSASDKGGNLVLDMDFLTTWGATPSTIFIESTVLSTPYQLTAGEMIPVGGGSTWSTYHAEIAADNITGNSNTEKHEFWVIAQYDDHDYTNILGVPNLAGDDKLAAFFRYDLFVSPDPYELPEPPVAQFEVVTSMPVNSFAPIPVTFHSTSYDPDPGETATLAYYWDFNGDGIFNGPLDSFTGTPTDPVYTYTASYYGKVGLKVQDITGLWSGVFTCDPLDVTINPCNTSIFPTSYNYYWNSGNYLNTYPCDATRAANPSKVIGAQNGAWTIAAYGVTGGTCSFTTSNSPHNIISIAMTSTDRVYFHDSGSATQIWYTDYTNASGFSNFRTAFSGGPVPSGTIWRICVDNTDNPIALAYTAAASARIFRHTGSTWGTGVTIPSEVWAACSSYSNITDLEFDPTTSAGGPCYVFTYQNPVNKHPGIFALKASDGSVLWKDTNIWPTGTFSTAWETCGVEIPMGMASCHIICFAGRGNNLANGSYLARYNPAGGDKATTYYTPGTCSSIYGQAALVLDNSVIPNVWKLYGNGAWSNNCISLNFPASGW